MGNSLLVTRPEDDPGTRYLSKWSEKIIDEAKRKSITVYDLKRDKANKKRVVGILENRNPKLVVLNGHGSEDSVTGHATEILISKADHNAIKDKIIYARACSSGKQLGPHAVANGTLAYLGYDEEFAFVFNEEYVAHPLNDPTAALFLEPSNYIAISLLKGHSAGDANERSKNLFRKNIAGLLSGGTGDFDAIRWLYWDMIHQVCVGNPNAKF